MPPARLLLTSAFGLALAAQSPVEVTSTARDRTALGITLYRNDLAMVRDTRRIALPAGASHLAFADVAASIRPKSAWMAFPEGVTVREQNYAFDLLSPARLTQHALHQAAGFRPEGLPDLRWGTLASLPLLRPRWAPNRTPLQRMARIGPVIQSADPSVLIRIEEGFAALPAEGLAFRTVPASLRPHPTLLAEVEATAPIQGEATLAYTAEGFTWQATYRARLSPSGQRMDLEGFVTLTNRSGTDFPATTLQLVAGEPNKVYDPTPRDEDVPRMGQTTVEVVAAVIPFREETLSDYLLLTLDRPTSVRNGQTKQVRLFGAKDIPLRRTFLFTWTPCFDWFQHPAARRAVPGRWIPGSEWIQTWGMRRLGLDPGDPRDWERAPDLNRLTYPEQVPELEPQREAPTVLLEFTNAAASNLGRPLPRGAFWMSTRTAEGHEVPLGETSLEDTPVGAEALLESPGAWTAAGVRATHRWRPVAWDPEGMELEGESLLENPRSEPAPILLRVTLPEGSDLGSANAAVDRAYPGTFDLRLTLPPGARKRLTFRARVPRSDLPFSDQLPTP